MKKFVLLTMMLLTVAACSDKAADETVSIEEEVIVRTFASYVAALTYDEVCNGADPKARYTSKEPRYVTLLGNQQMLAARLGGIMHLRNPEQTAEERARRMVAVKDNWTNTAKGMLAQAGCDSEAAQPMAASFKVYTQTPPPAVMAMIDKKIVEEGGTVTTPEKIQAAGRKNK